MVENLPVSYAVVELGIMNVHLMSGEDIIGDVALETDGPTGLQTYRIDKPVMPNVGMDPQTGQMRVGLLPLRVFLAKVTPRIDVLTGHVLWLAPVPERMADAYRQFVSDILIASPSSANLSDLLSQK